MDVLGGGGTGPKSSDPGSSPQRGKKINCLIYPPDQEQKATVSTIFVGRGWGVVFIL